MTKRSGTKKVAMASSAGPAKKARTPKGATKLDAAAGQPEEEDTAMTFSMELHALECPVCFIPFEAEVYMCKNGHGACAGCCIRTNRKCWSCCEPIGDIRNRQLETLLAAMITPCKFARYGCGETVKYTDKRGHEEICAHAPFDCPFDGCGFRDLDLYDHVLDKHKHQDIAVMTGDWGGSITVSLDKGAPFLVLVDPDSGRVFLLRNGGDVLEGRSLSLLWPGPRPERDMELKYTMKVTGDGPGFGEGALALSASGTAPCARRLEGFQAKGFLFVPDAYWGSNGTVSVRVSVVVCGLLRRR